MANFTTNHSHLPVDGGINSLLLTTMNVSAFIAGENERREEK